MTIDEDSSDEEENIPTSEKKEIEGKEEGIDIWKEFREMSLPSSQGTPAFHTPLIETHPSHLLIDPEVPVQSPLPAIQNQGLMSTDSDLRQPSNISQDTLVESSSLDSSKSVMDYTLQNGLVTIPGLGTFKQKESFTPLVTDQNLKIMFHESKFPAPF